MTRMTARHILIHDYSGHPFQVQLGRELARRGHRVTLLYAAFFETPHGRLTKGPDDPAALEIRGLQLAAPFEKYSFLKRRSQEIEYGHLLSYEVMRLRPDVVIASNTPLDALEQLQNTCLHLRTPLVFWVQDLYGVAIRRIIARRWLGFGSLVGLWYEAKERRLLRRSQHVVTITEDFSPFVIRSGVRPGRISVIHNWAPLEEMPQRPKDNAWSRQQGLADKFVFMYSGTLGLKHDPAMLWKLARAFREDPNVEVVVISQGLGATWLRDRLAVSPAPNLRMLPFQPFEYMPEVLGTADVLISVLEPSAGVFSVPSKVLSYMCAGRPILLSAPTENLAARLVRDQRAGAVCAAGDHAEFIQLARTLFQDRGLRLNCGNQARRYAESTFDIVDIAGQFEDILASKRSLIC